MPATDRLSGVYSPVVTPFNDDGSPSAQRLVNICQWLTRQDVGLSIFGTNSEANSLTVAEKRALIDALAQAGVDRSRLMPGTGACAVGDAVELSRHAVQAGAVGVLMLPPFYYKGVSDEGLYRYFSQVIEGVGDDRLRVFLYHIPPVAQVSISLDLIERLTRAFPRIVAGVKDSSGDWDNTQAMIERFGAQGFQVFAGSEAFLLRTLRAGGAGCITATGNVNPGPIVKLYNEFKQDDADAQQAGLVATRNVFQQFPMIPAMKAALAWKSGDAAWANVRPPLVELSAEQRQALQEGLDAVGFKVPDAASLAA